MNGQRKKVTLRTRLFYLQRGLCHWCRQPMVLNPSTERNRPEDPTMCTLDHYYDRWSPLRGTPGPRRNVAAHKKCNQDRARQNEIAAMSAQA